MEVSHLSRQKTQLMLRLEDCRRGGMLLALAL
jgi:hypothetical protein